MALLRAGIALLSERGRVAIGVADVLRTLAGRPGYAVLALDGDQALEFAALVGVKDPINRLILAAARATGSRMISTDEALDGFGVPRLWD
jgi:PIN domain nuclease of toxin-antitoxin system